MIKDMSYSAVMSRKNEIMKEALGIDYTVFESGSIAFDYERMMKESGYSLEEIIENAENDIKGLDELYKNSNLPDKIESNTVNEILLEIRHKLAEEKLLEIIRKYK